MTITIDATYEGGVLKPAQPLPLAEHEKAQERQRLFARDGTPSALVAGQDMWERLVQELPPSHRRILVLLQEGKTQEAAAAEVGVSVRSVERLVARVSGAIASKPRSQVR